MCFSPNTEHFLLLSYHLETHWHLGTYPRLSLNTQTNHFCMALYKSLFKPVFNSPSSKVFCLTATEDVSVRNSAIYQLPLKTRWLSCANCNQSIPWELNFLFTFFRWSLLSFILKDFKHEVVVHFSLLVVFKPFLLLHASKTSFSWNLLEKSFPPATTPPSYSVLNSSSLSSVSNDFRIWLILSFYPVTFPLWLNPGICFLHSCIIWVTKVEKITETC